MASNSPAVPTTISVASGTEVVMSITAAALSTTFTPPASCAEQRLTLAEPIYQLWLNDPQPVAGSRITDCYPSQWAEQFTSSPGWDMSVAPMMSPLVCPSAWTTASTTFIGNPDYIACCPKDFQFEPPQKPIDPNRPAYGGRCASAMSSGTPYIVTKYNTVSSEGTVTWMTEVITDHALAHPMDGYRLGAVRTSTRSDGSVVRITPTATSGNASGATNATMADGANGDNDSNAALSGGAIAGIVIGVVGGLALIAVAVFLLFRRRRNQAGLPEEAGTAGAAGAAVPAAEKQDPDVYEAPESPHYPAGELYATQHPGELHNHHYVAELGPGERSELPSNYHGHELR